MEGSEEAWRLSRVVGHPVRARIIELLGQKGPLGWKELSQELGVRTGALYHHLDVLEGLVERDPSKKYYLTKAGRIVYDQTSQSRSLQSVHKAAVEIRRQGALRRSLLSLFLPRSLLATIGRSASYSLVAFVLVGATLGAFMWWGRVAPVIYYLRPDPGLLQTVGELAASLAALVMAGLAYSRVAKSAVDIPALAAFAAISFVPVTVFSAISLISPAAPLFSTSPSLYTICQVFFQTWSGTIFGAGLSVASGVRIEKTLLVSLGVIYATMVLMLLRT